VHLASPHGYLIVATSSREQVRAVARLDQVAYVELDQDDLLSFGAAGTRESQPDPAAVAMSDVRAMHGADFAERVGGYLGQGVRISVIDASDVRSDHIDLDSRPIIFASPRPEWVASYATAVIGILCGDGTGDAHARGLVPKSQGSCSRRGAT
jgi:hypothetical protein